MMSPTLRMCFIRVKNAEKWNTAFVQQIASFENCTPIDTAKCTNTRPGPRFFRLVLKVHVSSVFTFCSYLSLRSMMEKKRCGQALGWRPKSWPRGRVTFLLIPGRLATARQGPGPGPDGPATPSGPRPRPHQPALKQT